VSSHTAAFIFRHLYRLTGLLLAGQIFLAQVAIAADTQPAPAKFSTQTVIDMAEKLSQSPFRPPTQAPDTLANMDYSTYRQINFQQRAAIWGDTPTQFAIQLFAPGFLYKKLVDIDIVENGRSAPIKVTESSFKVPRESIAKALAQVGKYAGFRLHFPLNTRDYKDEFVVFQGASYFRAVSKGQQYGLSARGLAIDVAQAQGEEHPIFTHFWIERPGKNQQSIVVHALLDSESVTGAYRFGIYPDDPSRMDVSAVLFPRRDIRHVGLAPLTSMFMHSPLVPTKTPDYRPAVHDSEALAIATGSGEHLWRPLNNPANLQISAFMDEHPKGFGLIQRHRDFAYYQDLEANYHKRPSAWIEPKGDWGKGQVELVEIPSDSESNDNIVVYWLPAGGLKKGERFDFAYRLIWPDDIDPMPEKVRVIRSAGGQKLFGDHREMVIDFSDIDPDSVDDIHVDASISQGRIVETVLQANPETGGARLFVSFDTQGADVAELRVQLRKAGVALSETWLYRWLKPKLFAGQ
jgi:glucan biosynthesis protein